MKRCYMIFMVLALLITACAAPTTAAPTATLPAAAPTAAAPRTLTVFAAASLTNAFEEIGNSFEGNNPGVNVTFNFGGSQALRTQIEQGASADVFASANKKEMDALMKGNFVITETSKVILNNQLIVVMPANNSAGLTALADLAKPGLKIVLAAKEVPVGNYAVQVLDKLDTALGAGFKDKVIANVVSYENDVKQVIAKVQLGEADAGIVYTSDTVAAPDLKKIEIPAENNIIAKYPIAKLAQAADAELAQAFIDFVLSAEGQSILTKWGFLPVK